MDLNEIQNKLSNKVTWEKVQFSAENSHLSYLTVLDRQDKPIGDYTKVLDDTGKPMVSGVDRMKMVQLVSHLHKRKGYRPETFHVAVSIMDRFLYKILCE